MRKTFKELSDKQKQAARIMAFDNGFTGDSVCFLFYQIKNDKVVNFSTSQELPEKEEA